MLELVKMQDMGRLLWSLRTGIFAAGLLVLIGVGIVIYIMDLDLKLWLFVLTDL
ncbi:MAG: hypothetical protein CM1200mP38_3040 [Dehalococcoidia bacterium]|nr:MAG: hypothetical protein CM1200mP38_3040 [Dehalococcoidia bacterium]